jgi:hypothetical protein
MKKSFSRRQFCAATGLAGTTFLLTAPFGRVLAHHGWSSFDEASPLYLEGQIGTVKWQNPHAELILDVASLTALPADLATRKPPAQQANVDAAAILKKVRLPKNAGKWEIELAPLTRMAAWQIEPLAAGAKVGVVGYTFPGEKPESSGLRVLRVEFLFVGAKSYALRSAPASP